MWLVCAQTGQALSSHNMPQLAALHGGGTICFFWHPSMFASAFLLAGLYPGHQPAATACACAACSAYYALRSTLPAWQYPFLVCSVCLSWHVQLELLMHQLQMVWHAHMYLLPAIAGGSFLHVSGYIPDCTSLSDPLCQHKHCSTCIHP